MLWGLTEMRRRVAAAHGPVRISTAELFLMCGDVEATIAVFDGELSDGVKTELEMAHLVAFLAGDGWYVEQTDYKGKI